MWNTTLIYSLFPNTILIIQGDHVELARIFPFEGRVDRAVMELSLYVPHAPATPEERVHWDKNMQLVLDVVTGEDFPAGRAIQLGLTSGAQSHTEFGRNEPAMIHYHPSMQAALRHGRMDGAYAWLVVSASPPKADIALSDHLICAGDQGLRDIEA